MENGSHFTVRLTADAVTPEAAGPGTRDGAVQPHAHSSFRLRRRNRHGRGLRSPLLPPGAPASLSRSQQFDQYVLESAERLHQLWGSVIDSIEFQVEDIPPQLEELAALGGCAPLGTFRPETSDDPAAIVIYRHPVQTAARGHGEVSELVHDAVVEQAAELLGIAPEAVDPMYGHFGG
ncbi:metallopeptidase family protein [Arthrobacter monumenti]